MKTKQSKNKKKGVTLVETIIAMALVVIISTMAFSICNLSLSYGNNSKLKNFFITQTQNYVKAYYLGGNDYKNAMELLTGTQYEFGVDTTIYYDGDLNISTESEHTYSVELTFGTGFSVQCYTLSNSLIYSYEV